MPDIQRDLTRTVLAVLFIGGLLASSFWILRPFLGALIWAVMIVVASWPLMRAAQSALWGRRWLAVTVMTLALLLLLIVPFSAAIATIVANVDTIGGWVKALGEYQLPPAPAWLGSLPVIGQQGTQLWLELDERRCRDAHGQDRPVCQRAYAMVCRPGRQLRRGLR